jgi:hypothetical protein
VIARARGLVARATALDGASVAIAIAASGLAACTAFADGESWLRGGGGAANATGATTSTTSASTTSGTTSGTTTTIGTGGTGGTVHAGGSATGGSGGATTTTSSTTTVLGGPSCESVAHDCVSLPSGGWLGLGELHDAPAGGLAPCAAGWTAELDGHQDLVPGAFSCSPCQCGAPQGDCKGMYYSAGCASSPDTWGPFGGCTVASSGPKSYTLGSSVAEGSCLPAGGQPEGLQPNTWNRDLRLCLGDVNSSCGPQAACVPKGASSRCVYADGDVGCPDGFGGQRTLLFRSFLDHRACKACGCAPKNLTCSGTAEVYASATCSGGAKGVYHEGQCAQLAQGESITTVPGPVGGSCSPSSTKPLSGGVEGGGTVTVCCQ